MPLLHLLLIGYLPMIGMRLTPHPAFAAGCGQFFVADRAAYEAIGGHGSISDSFHDGIKLPRAFRHAGYLTDIFDATDTASCRMYAGWRELWWGFVKNAHEGMAKPIDLPIWTLFLIGGHVLPWLALLISVSLSARPAMLALAALGCCLTAGLSLALGLRFAHPWAAIVGRPIGITLLVALQWHALWRRWRGHGTAWRGRVQPDAQPGGETRAQTGVSS